MTERWTRLVPYRVECLCPTCGETMRTTAAELGVMYVLVCPHGHEETSATRYPHIAHREEPVVP